MPEKIEFKIDQATDWIQFWTQLQERFEDQNLILLDGGVGAGKTTSLTFLAQLLGVTGVSSPTFALHQRYQSQDASLDHVDLYRMESLDEIEESGFWDLFDQEKAIIAVEWAKYVPEELWPLHFKIFQINIELVQSPKENQNSRHVTVVISSSDLDSF